MESIKKNLTIIILLIMTLVLGFLSILTAIRIRELRPIAPTVPQKKPLAEVLEPTPVPACTFEFVPKPIDTPTPTLTGVPTATPTTMLTPTSTPAASPTPTSTPTLTPTPTNTPAPTETPVPGNERPDCTGLSVNPTDGVVPLTVTLTGNCSDSDGNVAGFEFSFGDNNTKKIDIDLGSRGDYSVEHVYNEVGTYWASVRCKDDKGSWSTVPESCKAKIEVKAVPSTPKPTGPTITPGGPTLTPIPSPTSGPTITAVPTPETPEAGIFLPTIISLVGGAILVLIGILL